MNHAYTIVDIETTGNGIKGNKITEISIFRLEGGGITDEFTSLVNPECEIPYFITGLTGIDSDMVRKAPLLAEIAPRILEITRDCIFVAHSVTFDYHVIRNEFRSLGLDFNRKRLCTVRLSRSVFPGLRSYSLGKLCTALDIPLIDRHRARGDASATVSLFKKILASEGSGLLIRDFLNARSQEATLPPALPKAAFDGLPSEPGVYYFKNRAGAIIYVGKAINIKKRVLSHFYDKTDKEVSMCLETSDIDFERSGSELLALLMEAHAIRHHYPFYNRSQKRQAPQYAIFTYEDRGGIKHLAFNRSKLVPNPLIHFYSTTDCRLYLEQLCRSYHLCPKFCHLQEQVPHCDHFRIPACDGICRGTESAEAYRRKVDAAIAAIGSQQQDLLIRERGRYPHETAIVLVKDGLYCGYGFVGNDLSTPSIADVLAHITPQKNSLETQRLLQAYRIKHPENIINLSETGN